MSDLGDLIRQRDELDRRISEEQEAAAKNAPQVTATGRWLLDHDLWDRACDMLGLNPWVFNEEQMDSGERPTFTLEQARELGLV